MFNTKKPENVQAQLALASSILDADFQKNFNSSKGSSPVMTNGIAPQDFDACTQEVISIMQGPPGNIIPSLTHGSASSPSVKNAIVEFIGIFAVSPSMPEKKAAEELANIAKAFK